ncbi:MAG: DUF368 domain-containing protein [Clostridia bacterium]|nr:DUF368 domain-containing protein [Clostridia bacterium]
MELLKKIVKGMLIGIANVIPGVSGGTLAVSMGIYEQLIHSINYIIKEFKKSVKFLLPLGIGMIIAILAFSKLVDFCFTNYEINTTFVFVGLILGALPALFAKVKGEKFGVKSVIGFLIGFLVIVGMAFMKEGAESDVFPSQNPLILCGIGAIASMTMIIPGISGSLVLAILGFYRPVIATVSSFADKLLQFRFSEMGREIIILTFFGIGVIIGIIGFAKLIEFLFKRYKNVTYSTIIGIIVASPIALLINLDFAGLNLLHYGMILFFFAVGFFTAMKLGE